MIYMSFFIGLILICKGGDWFVDAASKLSEILGIPKYVIGATIVSFATTMPEIIVSVAAALDGHSAMAIGNAVGSVSANTGIILALSLFFLPVAIKREEYLFKNSLYIGTLLLLLISFKDRIFDRADCLLLLLAGILFLVENVKNAVCKKEVSNSKRKKEDTILHKKIQAGKSGEKKVKNKRSKWKEKQRSIWETFFWFCIGAVCIVAGSELLVHSACKIAEILHISEDIISVTIVAMGTSLPELVTTVTAILKKESSLSVGNIIGANMIDSAFILPICTLLSGEKLPVSLQMAQIDMPLCIIISVLALFPMLIRQKIKRRDGILVFSIYAGYLLYICWAI